MTRPKGNTLGGREGEGRKMSSGDGWLPLKMQLPLPAFRLLKILILLFLSQFFLFFPPKKPNYSNIFSKLKTLFTL